MTVELETKPAQTDEDGDDDPLHLTCHCDGNRIAMCGEDMGDEPVSDLLDEEEDRLCPMCDLIWQARLHCGCDCEWC